MNKRRIAIEWIIFLLSAVVGVAVGPGVIFILAKSFGSVPDGVTLGQAYAEMLGKEKGLIILPLGAYFIVSLIRSIIWAVKSASEKESRS